MLGGLHPNLQGKYSVGKMEHSLVAGGLHPNLQGKYSAHYNHFQA